MLIDWQAIAAPLVMALDGMGSPATIAVALVLTTLLVEDVAIAAGVALAAQGAISWELSFAAVGGGIAAGDLGLYALGLGATRFPWLRRYDLVARFGSTRDALVRGLPGAVLLARVVPGLRLVTYTACGALRVPLAPFCAWVVLAVSAWTAGLYALAAAVGHALAERLGVPAPVAVAAPILLVAVAVPLVRRLRARGAPHVPLAADAPVVAHADVPPIPHRGSPAMNVPMPTFVPATALRADVDGPTTVQPHRGMPPFDDSGPPLSFFEFWPMWAFYPPVALYAGWLMLRHRGVLLPTAANPSFPGGGFFGESKAKILELAMRHVPDWVAPFVRVDRPPAERADADRETDAALARLAAAGLAMPVVAKPDLGCRGAGVRLVRRVEDLRAYIAGFPTDAAFVLQRLVPHEGEAGVFWCREPGEARGRIVSITLKYFPYVHGDGRRTLRELILADPRAGRLSHLYLGRHAARLDEVPAAGVPVRLAFAGSHSRGAIFRDGTHLVTDAMQARFEAIARSLPEFHFGRFDVRFESFAELQQGRGFTIVEVNGAGAESTHIWDRRTGLLKAWSDLMSQYRTLFRIGAANRARGFRPMGFAEFVRDYRREKALTPRYPSTE